MTEKIKCSSCQCLKSIDLFIGKKNQITKSCSRCRDPKIKRWTYREDKDKCPRCRCWRFPDTFFKNGIKLKSCCYCREKSHIHMNKKRGKLNQSEQPISDIGSVALSHAPL